MMVPVRCFTCGKPVAGLYEEYRERVEEGEDAEEVLDDLDVERYCCRRVLVSHVDLVDTVAPYQ
ncbi:MAG: DNA-directed RNA polymerase subunit N [Halobacteriota archaeon]